LIASFVDYATRLHIDRRVSNLSFALLAVYLIVMTALIADMYFLAGGRPMTIRLDNVASRPLRARHRMKWLLGKLAALGMATSFGLCVDVARTDATADDRSMGVLFAPIRAPNPSIGVCSPTHLQPGHLSMSNTLRSRWA
jgi:hypothetical protein